MKCKICWCTVVKEFILDCEDNLYGICFQCEYKNYIGKSISNQEIVE